MSQYPFDLLIKIHDFSWKSLIPKQLVGSTVAGEIIRQGWFKAKFHHPGFLI
jgi:hypothetical protein